MARVARIALEIVAVAVALVVLAAGAGVVFLRTERGHEAVQRLLVSQASKAVPGLSVSGIDGSLWRDVSVRDVVIRDGTGAPALRLGRVTARYRLLPLLRRRVEIEDLEIDGLQVSARPDPRGGLNLEHLTKPGPARAAPRAPPAGGSGWSVAIARVRVGGASASIETAGGQTATIARLEAEGGGRVDGAGDLTAWVGTLWARGSVAERELNMTLTDARVALDARALAAKVGALSVGGLLDGGRVLTLAAAANGPRERVETHLEARAGDAGTLRLGATVGLPGAAGGPSTLGPYALLLDVDALDPGAWSPGAPAGRVSLSVRARGSGVPLAPGSRADAELDVRPSTLAGQRGLGGLVRARVRGDGWELSRGELHAAGIEVSFAGHGRARRFVADARVAINGARARVRPLEGVRGRATFALHVAGTPGAALALRGQGHVEGVVAAGVRVGHAALALDVRGVPQAPSGVATVVASDVLVASGAPRIDRANLRIASERGRVRLQASARGPRLRAAVAAHGTATGMSGDVTIEQLALDVTIRSFRQQLALVGPSRVRYRAGGPISLGRTVLEGRGARFTGRATVEGAYDPRAAARSPLAHVALELAHASTSGLAPVDAVVRATVTRTRAEFVLDARVPSAGAELHLDADLPVEVPRRGRPRLARHGRADVHVATSRVPLRTFPPLQKALARQGVTGGIASVALTVTGDVAQPEAHATFDLRDVIYRNIAGLGRDSSLKSMAGLGGALSLDAKSGSISADGKLIIRDAGVLQAHAVVPVELGALLAKGVPATVPLRASVQIPGLRLASITGFTDGLAGVDGTLRGRVEIAGELRHPTGHADLTIDDARVDDLRFTRFAVHGEADGDVARAQLEVDEAAGGRLEGSFTLDHGRGDRLEAFLTGKDLDVSFARVLLPNVRALAGTAQLSATAKGTLRAPRLWASLSLERGRVGVVGQPTFRDVRLAAALAPGRLTLEKLEMKSGDGELTGHGAVTLGGPRGLTPRAAELQAHAHRFLVAVAGSSGARIDGDVAVDAALRADVVAGRVEVPNASVWLSKPPSATGGAKLQKISPHADVHFVDAAAQAAAARAAQKQRQAAAAALRLALHATASPVYVRGKDLDLEVHSDLQIGTQPDGPHRGAVTLAGGIHIPRGRINIQGQRFDVDHGDVKFDGSWDLNPALDIKLTRQYPDALVVIELRGTPRKPDLRLASDPPLYDQAQIVSLVLTGQPGGQPSTGKPFDAKGAVATAVLSRIADQVAPQLGLDVLRVENRDVTNTEGQATGETDTRFEVGKYITERVYLSYAHVFGAPQNANQNEAHVEYRFTRRWMLETVFGDAGQGSVDALWTYRF